VKYWGPIEKSASKKKCTGSTRCVFKTRIFTKSVFSAASVYRHGKDKEESSHSGGKDKEEAGSSDRLRYDDKRYNNEDGIESYNAFNMSFM
jgi:hypothetical protein